MTIHELLAANGFTLTDSAEDGPSYTRGNEMVAISSAGTNRLLYLRYGMPPSGATGCGVTELERLFG